MPDATQPVGETAPEPGAPSRLASESPWYFEHRNRLIILLAAATVAASWWGVPLGRWSLVAGGACVAFSVLLRFWCIRQIGGAAHRRVHAKANVLVRWGPFGFARNPIYVANMGLFAALTVFAGLPWLVPVVLALLLLQYTFTINYEEKFLREKFGAEFDDYCRTTPRWLPVPRWVRSPLDFQPYPFAKLLRKERGFLIQIAACVAFGAARWWWLSR